MAKQTTFTFNNASFNDLLDPTTTNSVTKITSGAFTRQLEIFKIAREFVNRDLDQKYLRHKLACANMIAYPNQKESSHNLWAGKVVADWKRREVITIKED